MLSLHSLAFLRRTERPGRPSRLLSGLLAAEAWLDGRAGRRGVLALGDDALKDLGLSGADAQRIAAGGGR